MTLALKFALRTLAFWTVLSLAAWGVVAGVRAVVRALAEGLS